METPKRSFRRLTGLPVLLFISACSGASGGCREEAVQPPETPLTAARADARADDLAPEPAHAGRIRWYDFRFRGRKVGFTKTWDVETELDGRPAVRVHEESRIELERAGQAMAIESTLVAMARPDGEAVSFEHERVEAGQRRRIVGERSGEDFVVRHEIGGRVRESRIEGGEELVLASTVAPLFYDELEPGLVREGRALCESEGDVAPYRFRVVDVTNEGGERRFRVEETICGFESASVVRPDGVIERQEIPVMGAAMVLTDARTAQRLDAAVDLFDEAMFSASARLPDRQQIARLVLEVRTSAGTVPVVPSDRRQRLDPSTGRLTLEALDAPERSARIPVEDPAYRPFLGATPYESLDDPELVAASARAIGDATHVWPATQRLVRFVFDHIESKSLSRAFTSASEALESREGDCTEHAVLFSALAKIAGIPTRLVTGLVYVGGPENQFGYHEWAEVWTGDAWHPVDPTFGQSIADPTHIALTTGQSDPAGLRDAGLAAGALIGRLELLVRSYTLRDGETVRLP